MKNLWLLAILFIGISCKQGKPTAEPELRTVKEQQTLVKRYSMVTGLKPEKLAYYKELHAQAWLAVLAKITECNIRNYSIYLKYIDGKPYLFSYFEYTGSNFEADMKKMAADSTTQRWWRETDPCQSPLPEAAQAGQIWSEAEEVFHHD